jgi:hypothetical protein
VQAFVERLPCGVHVYFRAGPLARSYGDPWVWGCLGEIAGKSVTLIGYVRDDQPRPAPEAIKAIVRAALADGFTSVEIDRLGGNPRTVTFASTEEGKIIMGPVKKAPIPNISELFNADGTPNTDKGIAGFMLGLGQHQAGHIAITQGLAVETPAPDGGVDIVIKFHRK